MTSDQQPGHHRNTLKVGLTGGIASGKSTVADRFAQLGAPIIDTDEISRTVVDPTTATGRKTLTRLRQAFGDQIIRPDGQLDRAALRGLVFGDGESFDQARHTLEAIVHPSIHDHVREQIAQLEGSAPYVIVVIPLLAEPETQARYQWLDRIITVEASESQRRERLCLRPGIDPATADAMIVAQASDQERRRIADFVLDNRTTRQALEQQVDIIDQRLRHPHEPIR